MLIQERNKLNRAIEALTATLSGAGAAYSSHVNDFDGGAIEA